MYKEALRAAWAEINISNLDFNIKKIIEKVGPDKKVTGVIKADGYGHGALKCATVLRANGVKSFGVAAPVSYTHLDVYKRQVLCA